MKRFLPVLFILFALPAYALDLQEARARGLVCEKPDGTLAASGGGGEVGALVADINAKRATEYARISKQNQQPLNVIGQLAAAQILKQPGTKACK